MLARNAQAQISIKTIIWTVFVAIGFVLLSSTKVYAQKLRIDKVKGNKAMVTFNGNLEQGKVYDLGVESRAPAAYGGSRDKVIGFGLMSTTSSGAIVGGDLASISVLSTSGGSSSNNTTIGVSGKYGMNVGQYEYGGVGGLVSVSGSSSYSIFSIGGFFDYNLVTNRPGTEKVYGFGGEAALGSIAIGGSSYSSYAMYPNAFYKWFFLGPNTAIRADAGLYYRNISTPTAQTISGLVARLSFAHYF